MASRRTAEELIRAGRVTVNGVVVRTVGAKADADHDVIEVDGERLRLRAPVRTIALHKPRGVVSTLADPRGRPTVRDLVAETGVRLFPIGRLDLQTSGLLLLTNDGALAAGLTHPRRGVERRYRAKVRGIPAADVLVRLRAGVRLEDGISAVRRVAVVDSLPTKTWLDVAVAEGRSHLVRRLLAAVGHPVEKLIRMGFGPVRLGALPLGSWRDLHASELEALRGAAGLSAVGSAGAARRPRGSGTPPREPLRPRGPSGRRGARMQPARPRAAAPRARDRGPKSRRP